MKKLVLKIDVPDNGAKRKALKTVSGLPGIDAISIDMKERKMTIIGTVDPTKVVSKLRKYWNTELVTVGPAKEPEKEEPKKEEAKKEEGAGGGDKKPAEAEAKKDAEEKKPEEGGKKEGEGEPKKEGGTEKSTNAEAAAGDGEGEAKKEEEKKVDPVLELVKAYRAYNPHMTKYYYVQSMEENPNACVIC